MRLKPHAGGAARRTLFAIGVVLVGFSLSTINSTPAAGQYSPALSRTAAEQTIDDLFNEPGLHRGHSIVLRLYWAVLNRTPELGGARFWIDTYDAGEWDIRRIAAHFVVSQEFQDVYGDLDDDEFVSLIYDNMFDRDADPEGFAFWTGQLNAGMRRSEMVLLMSNDTEFINRRPLPSDERPDIGPRGTNAQAAEAAMAEGLQFFKGTEPTCAAHADRTFNSRVDPSRFAEARATGVSPDLTQVSITDGLGDQLVVDFDPPAEEVVPFGNVQPTVIYGVNGPRGVLPFTYSFGCPPDLYLGTWH